jgi:N-acetylmuramoyl-L-alanine amidase
LTFALSFGMAPRAEAKGLVGSRALAAVQPKPETQPQTAAIPPAADAAHLEDGTDRATLTFDLTRPVQASAFVMAKPNRVVVDLPDVNFTIDPEIGMPGHKAVGHGRHAAHQAAMSGLISSYRFGLFASDKSRIVINLSGPAKIVRIAAEPGEAGKSRLVIELAKTDRAAFQAAASKAVLLAMAEPAVPAPEMPAKGSAEANLPIIIIDPGHGGVDSGAMADGLVEKDIVFDFAKELAAKLRATGHYKIIMTRDSDVYIPLSERVKIARESHAALFISVHADKLTSDTQAVSGATVYTRADRATDADAARTAEKENQSDATAGVEGKEEPTEVSDILFDLTRRETRAYSHVFARTLVNYWKIAGRLNKNPERAAGFRVLAAPDVPSVLLELGYLSNSHDAKSLVSPGWRDATTDKVVAAVDAFFASTGTKSAGPIPTLPGGPGASKADAATAAR